jgi:aldehyde dehydrogenase (NAD+)
MTHGFDPESLPIDRRNWAGHWIDGRLVADGGTCMPVLRPSDGKVHAELPVADASVVDAAVQSAARAAAVWRRTGPRDRARALRRWADRVAADGATVGRLEALVSARPIEEVMQVDLPNAIEWIRFYAEYCDKLDGAVMPTDGGLLSLVTHEPYGVVAAIAPWNFPLVLALWKVAPAIAAGNAVVLKPSEFTPFSVMRVAELAVEAGLPAGLFNIVQGDGPTVGSALVRHPAVATVTFTGSTATGRRVMADAAESGPKPVSLELGGKGAQLVFADAQDLPRVAADIAWGITRNAGQLCYAGSRLVVQRPVHDELVAHVAERLAALRAGATWESATTLAPIINRRQIERIESIVAATLRDGAMLICGGSRVQHPSDGLWYAPTILDRVTTSMAGYREEIFGPVLAVQTFDDEEEGLALADHPVYGLTASVHTADVGRAIRAARSLRAGTVWVNGWGRKPDFATPFGGWNSSGFGKEAGRAGYEKFLRQKAVTFHL